MAVWSEADGTLVRILSLILELAERDGAEWIGLGPLDAADRPGEPAWLRFRVAGRWRELPGPPGHLVGPLAAFMRAQAAGGALQCGSGPAWRMRSPESRSRLFLIRGRA